MLLTWLTEGKHATTKASFVSNEADTFTLGASTMLLALAAMELMIGDAREGGWHSGIWDCVVDERLVVG